ncbi:MAG: efflux RND transporter periplasmic adaptor subunit [Alphaproteobacteria bacterium GM202ARS2]|nr:efflux RND transporter periplasmic adaptor subunit [Alphaproteobacteria bacterium GM202ARS2]
MMSVTKTSICLMVSLALCACDIASKSNNQQTKVRAVKTEVATVRPARQLRRFPAVLEPPQLIPLSFEVSGRVAEVDLKVGQRIKKGDLLATIEPVDLELRLGQAIAALVEAKAAAENARADAKRKEQLFARKVTSAASRDQAVALAKQAEARLDQAQSNVDLLRKSRSDAELRAPFNGVINSVDVQDFVSVQAGSPVVTLYEDGNLQATILVSFDIARFVKIGQQVRVVPADLANTQLAARVSEIGRRAPAVSSFPVIVKLDKTLPDLRSGMAVEVQIETTKSRTAGLIPIPLSALITNRSGPFTGNPPFVGEIYVFIPQDKDHGKLETRKVKIAAAAEDRIFISEGLNAGDLVVTGGVPFLRAGQQVRKYQVSSKEAE